MANAYTVDDLLDFLDHAGDKGLMPAATALALAVASRNILGILTEQEKKDLSRLDVDSVIRRFTNKRARLQPVFAQGIREKSPQSCRSLPKLA